MTIQKAGNQITLGNYVYLFESPAKDMTECAITAHGGHVAGKRFSLPVGVKVNYMTNVGIEIKLGQGPIRTPLSGTPGRPVERHVGPKPVADLVLGKSVGTKHWKVKEHAGGDQYYQMIEEVQDELQSPGQGMNWVPHVVTIRNRKFPGANTTIWLSKVIELVRAHNPKITTFYPYACRGVIDDDFGDRAGSQGRPS